MPSEVIKDEEPDHEAVASGEVGNDDGDDVQHPSDIDMEMLDDADATSKMFQQDDNDKLDFAHLADDFKEPLFVTPHAEPSAKLKASYRAQTAARNRYNMAKKQREDFEDDNNNNEGGANAKLGRLHNLMRESQEREDEAKRVLRNKTHVAFEVELQEGASKNEFVGWMANLKAYVKKYKDNVEVPLPSPTQLEEYEQDPESKYEVTRADKDLAEWVHQQQAAHAANIDSSIINQGVPAGVPPHHLALMENAGVPFQLSEEDKWHRSLYQFQLSAEEYWESSPIVIQETQGDLMRHIMEHNSTDNADDENKNVIRQWCRNQQMAFQNGSLHFNSDHYTKLVNAGFTFDVMEDDEQWQERVEMVREFNDKFGHVHVPQGYRPPDCPVVNFPNLKSFVDKVRTLIHRDALSPKRLMHLKQVGELYSLMGGSVYEYHVQACKEGRKERGEPQRTKRKFEVLKVMAKQRVEDRVRTKEVVRRGNMDNWAEKLDKLAAYKEANGNIDIQNDVKLRGWTFSIIRKLSINSASLKNGKMKLINDKEGLKEFLLQKEHVEMAVAEAKARKEEEADGYKIKAEEHNVDKEEEQVVGEVIKQEQQDLEELTEDVLLGHKEDDEVNAFMESGLQVPTV